VRTAALSMLLLSVNIYYIRCVPTVILRVKIMHNINMLNAVMPGSGGGASG